MMDTLILKKKKHTHKIKYTYNRVQIVVFLHTLLHIGTPNKKKNTTQERQRCRSYKVITTF